MDFYSLQMCLNTGVCVCSPKFTFVAVLATVGCWVVAVGAWTDRALHETRQRQPQYRLRFDNTFGASPCLRCPTSCTTCLPWTKLWRSGAILSSSPTPWGIAIIGIAPGFRRASRNLSLLGYFVSEVRAILCVVSRRLFWSRHPLDIQLSECGSPATSLESVYRCKCYRR